AVAVFPLCLKMLWLTRLSILRFKLDRDVINTKPFVNRLFKRIQKCMLITHAVDNCMRCQGEQIRSQCPHMEIMNTRDAIDRFQGALDFRKVYMTWGCLHKHVYGLSNKFKRTYQNEQPDKHTGQRVHPLPTSPHDKHTGDDCPD